MSLEVPEQNSDVTFTGPEEDWRADESLGDDEADPDDEELAETPQDVVAVLGFDPLESEQ